MKEKSIQYINDLISRYPSLTVCKDDIIKVCDILIYCAKNNGIILIGGNGGSSADSDHIVGELMKSFIIKRKLSDDDKSVLKAFGESGDILAEKLEYGIKAISLSEHAAVSTAVLNDNGPDLSFAQLTYNYANQGDILIAISTSGNAKNLQLAAIAAKAKKAITIALTGSDGGKLAKICDFSIKAPESETYRIQELHFPVYHAICMVIENEIFGKE